MKPIVFIFALLVPLFANAGAYEDMEEAMIRQDPSAIIDLLKRGVDVNTVDREGNTLLAQAIKRDLPDAVDYLMAHRARLNPRNKHGETAISIAAYNGRTAYVKKLVEAGAGPDVVRVSVGIENIEDIIADLAQALEKIA